MRAAVKPIGEGFRGKKRIVFSGTVLTDKIQSLRWSAAAWGKSWGICDARWNLNYYPCDRNYVYARFMWIFFFDLAQLGRERVVKPNPTDGLSVWGNYALMTSVGRLWNTGMKLYGMMHNCETVSSGSTSSVEEHDVISYDLWNHYNTQKYWL